MIYNILHYKSFGGLGVCVRCSTSQHIGSLSLKFALNKSLRKKGGNKHSRDTDI